MEENMHDFTGNGCEKATGCAGPVTCAAHKTPSQQGLGLPWGCKEVAASPRLGAFKERLGEVLGDTVWR